MLRESGTNAASGTPLVERRKKWWQGSQSSKIGRTSTTEAKTHFCLPSSFERPLSVKLDFRTLCSKGPEKSSLGGAVAVRTGSNCARWISMDCWYDGVARGRYGLAYQGSARSFECDRDAAHVYQ